jgi:hypothetical protein
MATVYYSIAIHLSFPPIHLTDVHCIDTMYSAGLDAGSVDGRFSSKYCFITVLQPFQISTHSSNRRTLYRHNVLSWFGRGFCRWQIAAVNTVCGSIAM